MTERKVSESVREFARALIRCQASLGNPLVTMDRIKKTVELLASSADLLTTSVAELELLLSRERAQHAETARRFDALLQFCQRNKFMLPPGLG